MKKLILIATLILLQLPAYTQSIQGLVLDENKEPLISATIQVYQKGIQKGGVITDMNGLYTITPLDTGDYSALFLYAGYDSLILTNIKVTNREAITVNYQLKRSKNLIRCYPYIRHYTVPLIDIDNPSKRTYTREEINQMPH